MTQSAQSGPPGAISSPDSVHSAGSARTEASIGGPLEPEARLRERAGAALDRLVRVQPDFPISGVLFRDLTPVLADAQALSLIAHALAGAHGPVDLVAGLESRGFLLAAAAAVVAGTGVLAVRKPGKLPGEILGEDYQLEYGTARLEVHPDDVPTGARVLIVDDVLATGGTAAAAVRLIQRSGGTVAGVAVTIELADLGGRAILAGVPLLALRTL